jgi:hypothetical protein
LTWFRRGGGKVVGSSEEGSENSGCKKCGKLLALLKKIINFERRTLLYEVILIT